MSHDDFAFEPLRGLPALLPGGEKLLWQGSPDWRSLAIRAYHVRKAAAYFLLLILWRVAVGLSAGHPASAMLVSCLLLLTLGAAAVGVLSLLAYLNARATVYSITSRRVLLRYGVAVPMTMNVPLKLIDHAAFKGFADGCGDIVLALPHAQRIGYLITWPHVRPGHLTRPQPSFRSLPDAARAAQILGDALAAEAGMPAARVDLRSLEGARPDAVHGAAAGAAPALGVLRPAGGPRSTAAA